MITINLASVATGPQWSVLAGPCVVAGEPWNRTQPPNVPEMGSAPWLPPAAAPEMGFSSKMRYKPIFSPPMQLLMPQSQEATQWALKGFRVWEGQLSPNPCIITLWWLCEDGDTAATMVTSQHRRLLPPSGINLGPFNPCPTKP